MTVYKSVMDGLYVAKIGDIISINKSRLVAMRETSRKFFNNRKQK